MLDVIFGNKAAERVLLYLANYQQGYARDIARTYAIALSTVQKQLVRLETGGVLVSRMIGRTRIYELNPRWYFSKELTGMLRKALEAMPEEDVQRYYRKRQRPRRAGKPLWQK